MLTPELACWLIKRLQAEQVTSFDMYRPGGRLRLQFARGAVDAAQQPQAPPMQAERAVATREMSPGMGYIRLKHPLLLNGELGVGDTITKGTLLAMLAVDEVLTPIEASRAGIVARLLVSDGELVGYGSPLIEWG